MTATFLLLSLLLALLPTLMMAGGTVALGLVLVVVASAIVTLALTLHGDDLTRFSRLLRPTAVVALFVPGAWMLLQVLPTLRPLANPIWMSASAALDKPLAGTVSLDIGATLLALARYCACLAAAFIAAAVTLDKPRAESILSLLTAIATLIAAVLIGFDLGYLRLPGFERADATDIAIIGFILSCATMIRAYELVNSSTTRRRISPAAVKVTASASLTAFVICLCAILIEREPVLLFAAMLGTGVLVSTWAIRRWRLSLWGQIGIGALGAIVVVGFFATVPARNGVDPTLALSTQSRLSSIERMLSDSKWSGSGAGSFEALATIYGDTDEQDLAETPTAAAVIAIEMGQPFLWATVIAFLLAASTLVRRALLRGRDYVYPSAGAGCIAALLIVLFASDGILGLTASLMAGVLCGLAFAQSKGTSNRDINRSEELYEIPNRASDRAAVEGLR